MLTRTQTGHHFDTVEVSRRDTYEPNRAPSRAHFCMQRKVEVRAAAGSTSEDSWRRHADHRKGHVSDENRLYDRTRRTQSALACSQADDRARREPGGRFGVRSEVARATGETSRPPKILAGYVLTAGARGCPTDCQRSVYVGLKYAKSVEKTGCSLEAASHKVLIGRMGRYTDHVAYRPATPCPQQRA